jgi:iron complex outermembrane recepter protein
VTVRGGSTTGINGTFPSNVLTGPQFSGSFSPDAWVVNGGLTLFGPDKTWQLGVECTNCFGETIVQSTLSNYTYLNRPMEWLVRAKVNF